MVQLTDLSVFLKPNFILFQTVVQSYTVGVIVSFYDTFIVLQALALTFTVVFALTLFTLNTKRDFSFMGYGLVPKDVY